MTNDSSRELTAEQPTSTVDNEKTQLTEEELKKVSGGSGLAGGLLNPMFNHTIDTHHGHHGNHHKTPTRGSWGVLS